MKILEKTRKDVKMLEHARNNGFMHESFTATGFMHEAFVVTKVSCMKPLLWQRCMNEHMRIHEHSLTHRKLHEYA